MEFSGRLSAFPLDNLLQWAATERPTGVLVIRRARGEKWVQLVEGRVAGCVSNDPRDFYGPWLVCEGFLDESQLLESLVWAEEAGARLGAAVVTLGLLDAATVRQTLRDHIRDQVCDLFFWRHGVFYFEEGELHGTDLSPEPLDGLALALEGSRRRDELTRMRDVFVHDNIRVRSVSDHSEEHLNARESRIVRIAGTGLQLPELHRRVQGPYFKFLSAVFELAVRGLLEIEDVGEEDLDEAHEAQEIALTELLLERAADRERALARERSWIPLELLGGLFPKWIRKSSQPRRGQVSAAILEFFERMDGKTPLRETFSSDPEAFEAQFEQLQEALRRNDLTLAAAPARTRARQSGSGSVKKQPKSKGDRRKRRG